MIADDLPTGFKDGRSSPASPRLGVVIPLANEEQRIDELLASTTARLATDDLVFCVLDNVSKDGTRGRIELFSQKDPRVRLVWAPENRCVVDAYFRGYREALQAGCRWILEMDGGFSHNPAEIPRFVAAMEKGADLAAGSRFVPGGSHRGSVFRYVVSRGGTWLANLMLGTKMNDMTSGFECFSRAALQYVVDRGVCSRAHFFQTEIRYMLHDWKWVEVPITYTNPSKSVGGQNIREAFRILWRLSREPKPSGASCGSRDDSNQPPPA
jgi:dolichol-phosphate mannosyltransferase